MLCNTVAGEYAQYEFEAQFSDQNPYSVNLLHLNPNYLQELVELKGADFVKGRYNIGIWYWESEKFPERWKSALGLLDEVWVTSSFTQKSVQASSQVPVTRITYPLSIDTSLIKPGMRKRISIEEDEYMFLFTFNYASVFERKNPLALLQAFRLAFRDQERVRLVIYCLNQSIDYRNALLLKKSCSDLPVTLIKKNLPWSEYLSLLAAADCYASLHRAEGLGISLAESMYLGKPVIATRYSGNLDFMTDRNSLLVDNQLVELARNIGPFEKGTVWAEPDVNHAAQLMRWVFSNRAEAKELGLQASAHVKSALDPTITAQEIQQRLHEIDLLEL